MRQNKFFIWTLIVSLCGFLFGFDTAIASGVETSIQRSWQLTTTESTVTISMVLIGAVIGAIFGGKSCDLLGRKTTLYIIAVLYVISAVGTGLEGYWLGYLFFRFIAGLGIGASSVAAPVYISEISPARIRGKLVAFFQLNIVCGILISYLFKLLLIRFGGYSWSIMLAIQTIPSLLFLALLGAVPESPRWLITKRNAFKEAERTLEQINPVTFKEDSKIIFESSLGKRPVGGRSVLMNRSSATLAILFAFFNQASGINAIIYYSPRIFEMTGLETGTSVLSTVGLGIINVVFTLLAMNFIDSIGRKTIMNIGSLGLIITLALISFSFYTDSFYSWSVPIYLFIYIGFFAFSQGTVIWVFISEIFSNSYRARGQTLGSCTHWIMAVLISFFFPVVADEIGGGNVFLFFSIMMCIQSLFIWRLMPETKGVNLEEMKEPDLPEYRKIAASKIS